MHCKPKNGEKPGLRRGIEAGSYCFRERAAFLVDQALGFNLVPTTVIREVKGEVSSVQIFVPNGETVAQMSMEKFKGRKQNPDFQAQVEMLTIFDYLIYNSDRHASNLLINSDGVHAIDNSLAFSDNVLKTLESAVDQPISSKVREMVHQLVTDERKFFHLTNELSKLLKPSEVRGFKNRLKFLDNSLQKTGNLPPPPVMFDPYN